MKQLLRWSAVLRRQFGERVQKVSLDIGAGCPHRRGLRDGGCIFCDERGGGSGAFIQGVSLREQVRKGIAGAWKHYGTRSIILYFQSYSATNLPLERFASALQEARDAASAWGAHALKFHPLYVLRGTPLETLYAAGRFAPLSREKYVERLVKALRELPDGIVLQRLTAGVRPARLVAPKWILDKESLERQIIARFAARL